MIEIRDNGPESRTIYEKADKSVVRSVYLPLLRGLTPRALEAFDPVTQSLVTGQRDSTTVPTQALFLLNSSFVRRQALGLAERLRSQSESDKERIRQAYQIALNREPTPAEQDRVQSFLAQFERSYTPKPIAPLPPPVESKPATNPVDPDNIDRTDFIAPEETAIPADAKSAAWMNFVQALFASAEFRFIR